MNFLAQIKKDISPYNRGRIRDPSKELVDARSLHQLIDSFERMDAELRFLALSKRPDSEGELLHSLLFKIWHDNGKNSEQLLLIFSDVLKKMMHENKSSPMNNRINNL